MDDLFAGTDALQEGYERIYDLLGELREEFHRSGRLDDSNAKLDEVSKLFATYLAYRTKQIPSFPSESSKSLIEELQEAFRRTIKLPQFKTRNGESVFASHPTLSLRKGDAKLARNLCSLVRQCVDTAFALRRAGKPFDVLNEAFGHFVRDNFRNNVEDAQFMTPPEVVEFMAELAMHDIDKEDPQAKNPRKHWTVMDPTCGVGSFLAAAYDQARRSTWLKPNRLRLVGQDKVDRMVRLAVINLSLFDSEEHVVSVGNSLEKGSPLDEYNGKVDLILTNPPFGARFDSTSIATQFGDNTPFFSTSPFRYQPVDSELLFIDRNLRLLRDGGRLLIVVPDGVVSAKGMAAVLRQHIAKVATVRAIIELPSVTFAQAGTRTKTSILYLQKGRQEANAARVFFGIAADLGFQVSSRKGVQIKVADGKNELPDMLQTYKESDDLGSTERSSVLCTVPSCVRVPEASVISDSWTANHYSAARFGAVEALERNRDIVLTPLSKLVTFVADTRRAEQAKQGHAFISVLHILGEGFVDVAAALRNVPKTPGTRVLPGEVILSKINPRIPRICVVPDFGVPILCSSEFEVMRPCEGLSPYALAFLLQSQAVQRQICSLTSGTSASHNRVRSSDLGAVLIPLPRKDAANKKAITTVFEQYQQALEGLYASSFKLAELRRREEAFFSA